MVRIAREIAEDFHANGPQEEAEAVRLWIRENVRYRRDPFNVELFQAPPVTIRERAGDCDDMAGLACCLLRCLGHDTRALAVTWKGQSGPSHAVCHDATAGLIVDPVAPVPCASWPPAPYQLQEFTRA